MGDFLINMILVIAKLVDITLGLALIALVYKIYTGVTIDKKTEENKEDED